MKKSKQAKQSSRANKSSKTDKSCKTNATDLRRTDAKANESSKNNLAE